jgi:hypothetical protein
MPPDSGAIDRLSRENQPWDFWRLLEPDIRQQDWVEAMRGAAGCLAGLPALERDVSSDRFVADILSETQFGPGHWHLSRLKHIYYRFFRPFLPGFVRVPLRTVLMSGQRNTCALGWPVEDRYVRFQFEIAARLMARRHVSSMPYISFWPAGKQFAFVLTHDIETAEGQGFVRDVAALEERHGFRSSFNFVPEKYRVDLGLIDELKARGFEVGVHGLKHSGRLFSSKAAFDEGARRINRYLKLWDAVGFRSPMTHRNPEWMQALEIEYDTSFFDTDPYEPMPGGTMSIWPFMMGRFVELPYTLSQDHTLMVTLSERTPRLWLEKTEFISRCRGLALLNAHPDYLRDPARLAIYEEFLKSMSGRDDFWHALPRETARWWRARAAVKVDGGELQTGVQAGSGFDFAVGSIRLTENGGIAL